METEPEGAWNVECKSHGLLPAAANRESVTAIVAEHWLYVHGPVGAAIEGRDWVAYPALERCDACGVPVELPAWLHNVKDGPLGMEEWIDEDGRWLMCDTCHGYFVARMLGAWVRHWGQTYATMTDYPHDHETDVRVRTQIAARLRILLDRLDDGTRYPW